MKRCFVFICSILFVLSACKEQVKEVKPMPLLEVNHFPKKQDIPLFLSQPRLLPIKTGVIEISEWYDNETMLFLTENNNGSKLQRLHAFTGKIEPFFEIDEPILSVTANVDQTYFAIQTSSMDDAPLHIVDQAGQLRYQLNDFGEDFSIHWSPYQPDEMIVVAFLPNWEFDVYYIHIDEARMKRLDIDQTLFQWLHVDRIGYLAWNQLEPSYFAPLYSYSIKNGETMKLQDEIISFFGFADHWLFVTVDSIYDNATNYHFYRDQEIVAKMRVPILNTYSDQWWVPYHAYDEKSQIFYVLRPYFGGDFFDYDAGFEIVSLSLETGEEEVVTHVDKHAPIHLSPNGEWMLYGNQYETFIDLKARKQWPLFGSY